MVSRACAIVGALECPADRRSATQRARLQFLHLLALAISAFGFGGRRILARPPGIGWISPRPRLRPAFDFVPRYRYRGARLMGSVLSRSRIAMRISSGVRYIHFATRVSNLLISLLLDMRFIAVMLHLQTLHLADCSHDGLCALLPGPTQRPDAVSSNCLAESKGSPLWPLPATSNMRSSFPQ
jgi:hypothetical protein